MGRILILLLGLLVVAGAAYYYVQSAATAPSSTAPSAPRQVLDNVQSAAGRIEDDAQRRADDLSP